MNKAELKERWGRYTDTDKLVDDVISLLSQYNHYNSENGVCQMLDKYFENKSSLIELFQKSEHYVGNMRIVMEKEFERENSASDVLKLCSNFCTKLGVEGMMLKKTDSSGKTMTDYLKVGVARFNASQLRDDTFAAQFNKTRDGLDSFNRDGYTKESTTAYNQFNQLVGCFKRITNPTLTDIQVTSMVNIKSDLKLAAGMKTSRAFNRICTGFGVNNLDGYNRLFAEYSDAVSGLCRRLTYVISVNPYDYLTMSFGKSWASCHTIDKNNRRNIPNSYSGMYCGGTLSYMLDNTSIITYVVDKGEDVQTSGKIYRNMFHFGNNILVQSRVYPQGNDGATDLYKKFRDFMQTEMAAMLGLETNMWTIKSGTGACREWTDSHGSHYKDYLSFSGCNVTYPSERRSDIHKIDIGHDGICPRCGRTHTRESYLNCSYCR